MALALPHQPTHTIQPPPHILNPFKTHFISIPVAHHHQSSLVHHHHHLVHYFRLPDDDEEKETLGLHHIKYYFFQKKLCESYSFCTTAVCLHFSRQAVIHAFIHPHSHHISHSCMHSRYFGSQPTIQSSFLLHHHHPHHHVISYDKALYFHTQHQQQSFRPFTSSSRLLSGYLCYSCRRRCCLNLFIKIALLNVDKMDTESGR